MVIKGSAPHAGIVTLQVYHSVDFHLKTAKVWPIQGPAIMRARSKTFKSIKGALILCVLEDGPLVACCEIDLK